MLHVGIIGLGFIGATHLAAWNAARRDGLAVRVVAVADPKPERRRGDLSAVRGNIGEQQEGSAFDAADLASYASAEELIADPRVDAVSICTPTASHVDLAIAAMRAGKHVLCEKPIAITAEPIERAIAVMRETGKVCMPAMCMRFWPAWKWLKDRVADRLFGEVRTATFTRLGSKPTRHETYGSFAHTGGGHFDLHIHDADFILHCFGTPTCVTSTGRPSADGVAIDHITTIYDYGDGKSVVAEGGWDQMRGFAYRMRFVVNFDRATADFDIGRTPQLLLCHEDGSAEAVAVDPLLGYDHEIRYFADAILAGQRPMRATLEESLILTRLLKLEAKSSRSRNTVAWAISP